MKIRPHVGGHAHGGHAHGGHGHGEHLPGSPPGESSPGHGVSVEEGFVPAVRPLGTERQDLARGAGEGHLLFLDLPSGIAGDMVIASLVDLGVPLSVVEDAVSRLNLPGVRLSLRSGYAGAIGCSHFDVAWDEQEGERSYRQIVQLLEGAALDADTRALALKIFARLAQAEADVHRTTLEHVHFHEVGAVDAIVDIVGAAAAFCYLGATVKASAVPIGRGFVNCRHGVLPLPAPATLYCLQGVPTVASELSLELVTPTGAAILASVAVEFGDWFPMSPVRVGFGAGTRGLPDRPNAMRAILGKVGPSRGPPTHVLLEANVDDMTGEVAAHALARVLESGALDVWIVPITMKKGRPGWVFSALTPLSEQSRVTEAILRETTTIGVRQSLVSRVELERTSRLVQTQWGMVRVKTSGAGTSSRTDKPELEDCVAIASREAIPLRVVLEVATEKARETS